jgi:hypothetical protein
MEAESNSIQGERMSPEEIVRAAFQHRRQRKQRTNHEEALAEHRQWKELVPQLTLALRSLTTEQGQRIAEDIWSDFDPKEDDYLLAQLGASVPGALATIQGDMVERGIFYPSFLYLGASDDVAKRLIELISAPVIIAIIFCCCASHGLAMSASCASFRHGARIRQSGRPNSTSLHGTIH